MNTPLRRYVVRLIARHGCRWVFQAGYANRTIHSIRRRREALAAARCKANQLQVCGAVVEIIEEIG